MSKSDKREARFSYHHLSKELKTQHFLVHNQMDEDMEDRIKHMEETFQKEATKICEERANLKLQQLDLVQILIPAFSFFKGNCVCFKEILCSSVFFLGGI